MRKLLPLLCALIANVAALNAQSPAQIRSSGDYLWAEGVDIRPSIADDQALDALIRKLSTTDIIPCEKSVRQALWRTYKTDLRNRSKTTTASSGSVIRYIAWRDVEQVFQPRWKKVKDLLGSAEKAAGNPDVARTYVYWAETYLSSLPSGEPELRRRAERLKTSLGRGRTDAVKMRNIEREVEAIRLALAPREPKPVTRAKPVATVPAVTRPSFGAEIASLTHSACLSPLPLDWSPGNAEMGFKNYSAETPSSSVADFSASALAGVEIGLVPTAGLMLCATGKKWGAYLSARSNFLSDASDYDCHSDGTASFGYIWPSGAVRKSRLAVSAGPVLVLRGRWSVYAGAGYGARTILWEDTSGSWARVTDLSSKGLLLEAGAIYRLNHLTFSAGISETAFSSVAVTLSAGLLF